MDSLSVVEDASAAHYRPVSSDLGECGIVVVISPASWQIWGPLDGPCVPMIDGRFCKNAGDFAIITISAVAFPHRQNQEYGESAVNIAHSYAPGGTGIQILAVIAAVFYVVGLFGLRGRKAGDVACSGRDYMIRKIKTSVADRGGAIWGAAGGVAAGWGWGGVAPGAALRTFSRTPVAVANKTRAALKTKDRTIRYTSISLLLLAPGRRPSLGFSGEPSPPAPWKPPVGFVRTM